MPKEKIEDYEESIVNFDNDIGSPEINVNPSFFIYKALVKAQNALEFQSTDNMSVKFAYQKFRIFVEQAETICKKLKFLDDEYYNDLKDYEDKLEENNDNIRIAKICNYKMGLILSAISDTKPIFDSIKLD